MSPADAIAVTDLAATVPGHVEPREELARASVRAWVVEDDGCDDLSGEGRGPLGDAGGATPGQAGGRTLGYVICSFVLDEVELLALAIRPEARRRGAGSALLRAAIAGARAESARRVLLEVARDNAAARRLYERAGFVVFNVRRGYYRATGQDALEMELLL